MIEVASCSTLVRDRGEKSRLYARAGIKVYWILNLIDSLVEVYTDPSGPGPSPAYRQDRDYSLNDSIPLVLEGHDFGSIPIRDLLP